MTTPSLPLDALDGYTVTRTGNVYTLTPTGRTTVATPRPNMIEQPDCYGCLGTGYHQGFGSKPGTPCLHHGPECEPGSCVAPCELLDDEDDPFFAMGARTMTEQAEDYDGDGERDWKLDR